MPTHEELTIGVVVVNLERRVADMQQRCTRDANAFAGRIEALEKRSGELEDHYNSAADDINTNDRRALGYIQELRDRIKPLENGQALNISQASMVLTQQFSDRQQAAERERRADWKATYNAVLPVVLQMCVQGCSDGTDEDEDPGETAHRDACASANRAHGPLEAKAQCCEGGGCSDVCSYTAPTRPRPPDPTPEMLETPEFNAVWQVIKNWDVDWGGGVRSGATGNDARAILDALRASKAGPSSDGWDPNSFATVRSYTSYGQTTHWVRLEDVNALVKAARDCLVPVDGRSGWPEPPQSALTALARAVAAFDRHQEGGE